jgi:hypothetical protein
VSDRKYRQHGYQDRNEPTKQNTGPKTGKSNNSDDAYGPRAMKMPASHNVSRCAQCGVLLQSVAEPPGKCPKCGFELHSCKQCTYFDGASRFECTQLVVARLANKDARYDCTFYAMSVRVEKETSTPAQARPMDARQAFENLFKK